MVHQAPGSEPASTQPVPPKTPPSKKPSAYIFDSNGDTRIILSTYRAQSFKWETDKIWIEDEKPTKENCKNKKRKKKKGRKVEPPPSTTPPAPQESPVTTSTSLGGTTNAPPIDLGRTEFSDFSNVRYALPESSDSDEMDPGCTDPGTNPNNKSLQIQDWDYGETCVLHLKKIEFRMLVSGKHLELASPIFRTMVTGPFAEGKADSSGFRLITASDWDPEAFKIVLTIMHGYNRDIPKSLSLEMLVKVAMIVNYYDCLESVELYADIWLEGLESEVATFYGRDCVLWMFISWVFSEPIMFRNMTQLALTHSQKLIEAEDFPVPADILEEIDTARQSALAEIFSAIYELLDRLQEEQDCSFECSSMLLGILTKELNRHGILNPRNAPPFDGFSIEVLDGIRNQWGDSGEDRAFKVVQGIAYFQEVAEEMRNRTDTIHQRDLLRSHRGIKDERKLDNATKYSTKRSLAEFRLRNINITPIMIEWICVPRVQAPGMHSHGRMPVSGEEDAKEDLVFKFELGQQSCTLLELLISEDSTPKSPTERFNLVKLLSKTLLFLHLGFWLHKGICSDNVPFLSSDISTVDLGAAYIGGFEYSRLFRETRLTQNVGDDKFQNLYRHPNHQGHPVQQNGESADRPPFSYKADLYSLGVVLVEISLWSSIVKLLDTQGSQDEYKSMREAILDMVPEVRMRMGDAVADTASACLRSDFKTGEAGQPESVQETFYLSVVRPLEGCYL
ncbi:hypothetical protein BFJ72_g7378 [Fusarium proliferatum]|uniref:Protein kinase domain-containing protein n=1 Tax=Gibberella intermedia TaxID=948311 RepID=A0A420T8S9_GIBIN|nr:hypothetical protein BFJ72_g7378 [Fusarium proliferatum]